MKRQLIFILLLIPLFALSQKARPIKTYKHLKSIFIDLNHDGKKDTISISSNTGNQNTFNRIDIKLAGYPGQTFKAKEYWTEFDSAFLKKNKNLTQSKLLYIDTTNKYAVILLTGGNDGAGYNLEFSIVNIEANNIKMVFDVAGATSDKNVEIPVALTDIDNDRRLDFIYRVSFQCSQILPAGKVCAYSPYFVYSVDDNCKLNKPPMKAYNQRHYVFAGYDYSEKSVYIPLIAATAPAFTGI